MFEVLFGFKRRDCGVTLILLHLGLPSFNTVIQNSSVIWVQSWRDSITVERGRDQEFNRKYQK